MNVMSDAFLAADHGGAGIAEPGELVGGFGGGKRAEAEEVGEEDCEVS